MILLSVAAAIGLAAVAYVVWGLRFLANVDANESRMAEINKELSAREDRIAEIRLALATRSARCSTSSTVLNDEALVEPAACSKELPDQHASFRRRGPAGASPDGP
jgi:hypothetical protein